MVVFETRRHGDVTFLFQFPPECRLSKDRFSAISTAPVLICLTYIESPYHDWKAPSLSSHQLELLGFNSKAPPFVVSVFMHNEAGFKIQFVNKHFALWSLYLGAFAQNKEAFEITPYNRHSYFATRIHAAGKTIADRDAALYKEAIKDTDAPPLCSLFPKHMGPLQSIVYI